MDLKGAEIRNFYEVSLNMIENNNINHGLKIPHYQRPYRWDEDNVEKLIEDWSNHKESTDYFCGSVVTVSYSDKPHDLIDGQQRLTTLFLSNFALFLVLRELVYATLTVQGYFAKFEGFYDELVTSSKFLFNDNDLIKKLEDLKNIIFETHQFPDEGEEESAVDIFATNFGLYIDGNADEASYSENLEKLLRKSDKLFLSYDRSSFNESLIKILSRIMYSLAHQSDIELRFVNLENIALSESETNYKNSILKIIEYLLEKIEYTQDSSKKRASVEKSILLRERIKSFIEDVKICTVQTGNPEDAYTLFEVLNDRALALDDLDLIKNLFYKNFVLKSDFNDAKKDSILQDLDNKWVEKIFKPGISESEKKLVTYFAIVYITGDEKITYNSSSDYRSSLKKYFSDKRVYSNIDIERDFNIFKACSQFVNIFNVKFKSKDLVAVEAEYGNNSVSYKLVHFLMAIKQEGVLSGFINFILKFLEVNNKNYEEQEVSNSLTSLIDGSKACDKFEAIETQAKELWCVSMMSKDAKNPRDFAVRIIKHNHLNSLSTHLIQRSSKENLELIQSFEEWLRNWQYSRSNTVKLRILFAKLLRRSLDSNGNIIEKAFELSIKPEAVRELQIDHMEPQVSNLGDKSYFQNNNRDFIINGIGNMMPLPAQQNQKKSNSPLASSLNYYDEVGLGEHFIMQKSRELLKNEAYANGSVPKEEFFNKRREILINWFKELLNLM